MPDLSYIVPKQKDLIEVISTEGSRTGDQEVRGMLYLWVPYFLQYLCISILFCKL
jgi:hypothetical protein